MAGWWGRINKRLYISADTEDNMGRLFKAWDALSDGGWQRPLLGAGANIGFDMLTLYFIFIVAGYGMPLLLGKMAFLIPGGVGVSDPVVVVVILIYRLLSFWLPSLFGFPLAAYLQR